MTPRARETFVSRRSWLMAGLTVCLSSAFEDQPLQVRYDGDTLRVTAPSLHFLTGKALERLKDGDAVAYMANLELLNDSRTMTLRQQKGRFVVSYALWEERFSVTQLASRPSHVDGLSTQAAESWCFDSLALSTLGLSVDTFYWLRFDIHTANAREIAAEGMPGFSIARMIEWLGKKNSEQTQWGPLERRVRLADLPRLAGRGSRG
ncbi:MAG TPA: hypothetical protein VMH28_32610 [Candidatus Acidoferrales bacterium]|nr:hypothetical protein [Candidatus Acidoferrales bacterium]